MGRGKTAEFGETRTAANGYQYTKVEGRGWVLTHWLTAEKKLGRQLEADEQVRFVDKKYKFKPTDPNGVVVIKKRKSSLRRRKTVLEQRIADLQEELAHVLTQLRDEEEGLN